MYRFLLLVTVTVLAFVSPLRTVTFAAEQRLNVLLLCIDDLRPELHCFGKDYIRSPNIDALAASGRAFHRHYVQAPDLRSIAFYAAHGAIRIGQQQRVV